MSSCCERIIPKHDPACPLHTPLDHIHGAPDRARCSPTISSPPAVAAVNLTLDGSVFGKAAFEGVAFLDEVLGVVWSSLRVGSREHLGSGQNTVQVVRNLDKVADLGTGEREIKSTTK